MLKLAKVARKQKGFRLRNLLRMRARSGRVSTSPLFVLLHCVVSSQTSTPLECGSADAGR